MKPKDVSPRYREMLRNFAHIPRQMLAIHDRDNLSEFVLHSLCAKNCLNLSKAVYLVDNPDFDCLKGVAGFNKELENPAEIWKNAHQFSQHMQHCGFNKKVKGISRPSVQHGNRNKLLHSIADELHIVEPVVYEWPIKFDNHGILLLEAPELNDYDKELLEGLCILGFCPVSS